MPNSEFLPISDFWKIACVYVLADVRRNRLTSDATDQEIETRITKWLQNAPNRNGGWSERMRRKERWCIYECWKAMPNCSLMLLLFVQKLLLFEEKTVFQCLFALLNSMQCLSVFSPTNFSVWTVKDWQCSNAKCVFYSCTIYVPVMFQFTVKCFFEFDVWLLTDFDWLIFI